MMVRTQRHPLLQRLRGALVLVVATCALAVSLAPRKSFAFLNEAISLAFEAAVPYIEEGFEVREDNWHGEIEAGKALLVKHQLFRGNEYWFWAATSFPEKTVKVEVFDQMGIHVSLETFSKEGTAGARVLPQATDTYYIRVTVLNPEPEPEAEEESGNSEKDDGKAAQESESREDDVVVISVDEKSEAETEETTSVDWGLTYGYR